MVRRFPTKKGIAMSTTRLETRRWGGIATAAALLLASASAAQAPRGQDYLEQVRQREEVARQKLEADVRAALRDVQALSGADSAKALERLQGLLKLLENDTLLPKDRRDRLQRMVKDRVRVTELERDGAIAAQSAQGDKEAKAATRRKLEEEQAAERERLRREIEAARQQHQQGNSAAASRQAADVAGRNPTSPAAQASSRINSAADQVNAARRFELDRQRGLAGVNRDIVKSATPPAGDMDFPKDWAARVKNRTTGTPLSAKEKSILDALATPVMVNFKNSRFDDVIEYLSTLTGQPILVDPSALKEAEVTYETPVTLNAKGVTVRTALRKVLAELGLSYVIKDEIIQVTTITRAREMMVIRSYPVADLVILHRPEFGIFPGRPVSPLEVQRNVDDLMRMFMSAGDAGSWQANGGTGTIAYHAPSNSIIVKQTAEVHMMLGRR